MREQLECILADFSHEGEPREARMKYVLPILQRIQQEFGYIPREAMRPVARFTGVPESHIFGVSTFYAQFKHSPIGRHVITVCRGTACHVRRSSVLLDDLCQHLGIAPGETTADRCFTLQTVACIGSCALAPVLVIDGKVYGQVDRTRMQKLIDACTRADAASQELAEVSR